jgi:probable dihydroxyacetone kinase regulator
MQNTKSDITKKVLADSVKKLLLTKQLNKISIKEIVSDSGLNRQTFYYHFEDIYALMEWIFKNEALVVFNDYEGEQLWQVGLKKFLIYIDQNRLVCQNTLNCFGHENMTRVFYSDISKLVGKAIDNLSEGYDINETYKNQLVQYFSISFSSIIEQWTYNRFEQNIDELIEFLDRILQDQILGTSLRLKAMETS